MNLSQFLERFYPDLYGYFYENRHLMFGVPLPPVCCAGVMVIQGVEFWFPNLDSPLNKHSRKYIELFHSFLFLIRNTNGINDKLNFVSANFLLGSLSNNFKIQNKNIRSFTQEFEICFQILIT